LRGRGARRKRAWEGRRSKSGRGLEAGQVVCGVRWGESKGRRASRRERREDSKVVELAVVAGWSPRSHVCCCCYCWLWVEDCKKVGGRGNADWKHGNQRQGGRDEGR
jgi:hypothetical protein